MKLRESEDYLVASLLSVHYMIKDLDLDLQAGKIRSIKQKYHFMLDSFMAMRKEFLDNSNLSLRFSNEFSRDLALIELGILGNDSMDDKIAKCLIALSMYDFMNYA